MRLKYYPAGVVTDRVIGEMRDVLSRKLRKLQASQGGKTRWYNETRLPVLEDLLKLIDRTQLGSPWNIGEAARAEWEMLRDKLHSIGIRGSMDYFGKWFTNSWVGTY